MARIGTGRHCNQTIRVTEVSLSLKIENVDQLPDGGPVIFAVDQKGLDIGRDPFMDWTLPDPQRFISGTHCHIRYQDNAYWLHDVSTNGTMVNGASSRLTEPYKLQDGDRIHIGGYIVAVSLSGGAQPVQGASGGGGQAETYNPWDVETDAPPVDARQFRRESGGGGARPMDASFPDENVGFDRGFSGGSQPPAGPAPSGGGAPSLDFGVSVGGGSAGSSAGDWSPPPASPGQGAAPSGDWRTGGPAPAEPQPQSQPTGEQDGGDGADWRKAADPAPGAPAPAAGPSGGGPAPSSAPPAGAFDPGPAGSSAPPPSAFDPAPAEPSAQTAGPFEREPAQPGATPGPDQGPAAGAFDAGTPDWRAEPPQEPAPPVQPSPPEPAPQAETTEEPLQLVQSGERAAPGSRPAAAASAADFVAAFERGAGVPPGTVSGRSDEQFAEEVGQLFRAAAEGLTVMLKARSETKTAMRSDEVTQFSRRDNNPLKSRRLSSRP